MSQPKTIVVTARDIKRGKRRQMDKCPIALAVNRRYGLTACKIDFDQCVMSDGTLMSQITGEIEDWMTRYDNGRRVKPTRFTVNSQL